MKRLATTIGVLTLVGCAQWPDDGYGGVGEIRPVPESLKAEGILLATKLSHVRNYVDILASIGAQACLPGKLKILQTKLNHISRETYSGYYNDARVNLHQATLEAKVLQCQLQAVQRQTNCSMPVSSATTLDRWYLNVNYSDCATIDMSEAQMLQANEILFASGKAGLSKVAKQNLDTWVKHLQQFPDIRIEITGHTDSVGKYLDNNLLSDARAKTVADFLAHHGIDKNRLIIESHGEYKPRTQERNAHELQLNRRVILQIVAIGDDHVSL